ncbi:hypothetical protein [Polaromonas sp.]|uniref:hypothetical protein n=1 Tax=Polaromonas sp. TaxID=1869339 RepID=UPI003BAD59B9
MSFLSELKSQASALQKQQVSSDQDLAASTKTCESACQVALRYFQDLCAQLNIISPSAIGNYSLDGKAAFPLMVMKNFRCDARRKMLRNQEVTDYVGSGWDLVPVTGNVAVHSVTVNFPPDLERVTRRLSTGQIQHERKEIRHPDTNKLQAYVFEYRTQSRGSVLLTPDHDTGQINFRIGNVGGFELLNTSYPASQVTHGLLDELAKKIVGQTSRFN